MATGTCSCPHSVTQDLSSRLLLDIISHRWTTVTLQRGLRAQN